MPNTAQSGFIARHRTPLLMLLIGIPIIIGVATLKPAPEPQRPKAQQPLEVAVSVSEPRTWTLSATSQGTVEPKREINLVAEISGRIVEASPKFVSGGAFAAGELLIKIDDRDYRYALVRAKARVADARQLLATEQGRARQAKREWRDLGNREANDLFLRKPQLAAAKANLEASLADQHKAELDLKRTEITLPFAGRVRKTLVNLGQYVTPGTPIASAYDSSTAEIRLPLTERQAALINLPLGSLQSDAASVKISGSVAGQPHQWQGKLTRTDASLDTRSRLYYAIAEVEDPYDLEHDTSASQQPPLMIGLFVEATIEGKPLSNVVRLPKTGLYQNSLLYTLSDQNQVIIKRARVLSSDQNYVWLRADLTPGESVILEKQHYLKAGMSVRPIRATESAETSAPEMAQEPQQ